MSITPAFAMMFYCEVDDLDLDYLTKKGYTYESFFPEAPELTEYINKAFRDGRDIICQCEYGQSRSAGCAAAILEHFYRRGIEIFADYKYYPNQVVYHKVFDALESQHFSLQSIFSVFTIIPAPSFRLTEMQ